MLAWSAGALLAVLSPAAASAQTPARPRVQPTAGTRAPRVEVGAGTRWIGRIPFDRVDASETVLGGGSRTLFSTETALQPSLGVEGRIGVRLASAFSAEGSVAYVTGDLATHVSSDIEGAADATISEPVKQYMFAGGLVVQAARWRAARLAPFLSTGVGYVRQLHDGAALVATGLSYYVGGGVHCTITRGGRGRVKSTGLRGDVRATFFDRELLLDQRRRAAPTVSASYFVRF